MKNWFFALFGIAFLFSCMDKPTGESDDQQLEMNTLKFENLYSTDAEGSGNPLLIISETLWTGSIKSKGDNLFFNLKMPNGFDIPMDPDAPDTLPAKVSNLEIYIIIADELGNSLLENRVIGELKSSNNFVFEIPAMALKQLKVGKHQLSGKCAFRLKGKNGSNVGEVIADWHWNFTKEMPPIYKTKVSFNEFRLSDACYNKSKENNDGLGNPLPDLFWSFSADGIENFRSSTYENSNPYMVEKLTFNVYHLSKDPQIVIQIYDDDYTSMNDLLAKWTGNLSNLIAQDYKDIKIKGLDFFHMYATKSEISNK